MHNAALKELRISGVYELFQIREKDFETRIRQITSEPALVGFNVTIPYKERILPHLIRMDLRSEAIGAVNTVKILGGGKMAGYNTDVDGILISLEKLGVAKGSGAVILGAGGAARACAYVLLKRGCRSLILLNRTGSRSSKLRREFGSRFPTAEIRTAPLTRNNVEKEIESCDLLINALANPSPLEFGFERAKDGMKFFDLWYKPTRALLEARKSHIRSIDGFLMLVEQAARSIEIWTGRRAPRKAMYAAGKRVLSRQARAGSL